LSPPVILIVSPYAAAANNGNTRTAERWARLLSPDYRAIVRTPQDPLDDADVLVALHARRSHAALRDWRARDRPHPCILVLTGTDLYRDIPERDASALESLALADALIVLQERGIEALPAEHRGKATVVYQSAAAMPSCAKSSRRLNALFVGHLREEKDPFTFMRAAAALSPRKDISFALAGGLRDAAIEANLEALHGQAPNLRLLGALSHGRTRQRIRRAHVLVVPSRMEGGANVIVEAVMSETPVLASDCDGNVGMLGAGYPGYFPVGDDAALARLLVRCRDEPAFLANLQARCRVRAPLFTAQAERQALVAVLERRLAPRAG
jgi:putative glycosyltransferase (TIGR04348 family)